MRSEEKASLNYLSWRCMNSEIHSAFDNWFVCYITTQINFFIIWEVKGWLLGLEESRNAKSATNLCHSKDIHSTLYRGHYGVVLSLLRAFTLQSTKTLQSTDSGFYMQSVNQISWHQAPADTKSLMIIQSFNNHPSPQQDQKFYSQRFSMVSISKYSTNLGTVSISYPFYKWQMVPAILTTAQF